MRSFTSLRRQADFARLRRHGRRISTKSLVIYHSDSLPGDVRPLAGFSVSKTVGKAVLRNRLRRRLAAILDGALAERGTMRLLFVARPLAAGASFRDLRAEVTSALEAV
jgi:ribonuclease P protein component